MSTPSQPKHRIFISHSTKDNVFGLKMVKDLRRALQDEDAVWYDVEGGLHGGDTWWRKIVAELTTRNIFIVVLSPDSMASDWVNDEIDLAWRQKNSPIKMRILPVLLYQCTVRADLYNLQIVSFLSPKTYEMAFNELLIALGLPPEIASPSPDTKSVIATTSRVQQLIGQIQTAFAGQDWPDVIRKTNLLIKRAPDDISAAIYRMQGVAFREEGDQQHAQEALETALTLVEDRQERLVILRDYTDLLASQERWNEVLRASKEALRLLPNDPGWLAMQVRAQSQLVGTKSVQLKSKVQEQTRDRETPLAPQKTKDQWLEEGFNHLDAKEYQKAITDYNRAIYNRAIELDPQDAVAYYNRGLAYDDLKKYEKAIADNNRAIQLNPQYVDAYNNRGLAYDDLKEYEQAIADYDRALELDPNHTLAHENRDNAYRMLQRRN